MNIRLKWLSDSAIGGITLTNSTTLSSITLTNSTTLSSITFTNSTPFVTFNAEFAREITYLLATRRKYKASFTNKMFDHKTHKPRPAMLFFAKEQFLSNPNVYHCCTSVRHFSISEPTGSILRSLFKIDLNIIFPSTSSSSKRSHVYRFSNQHTLRAFLSHKATPPVVGQPDRPNVLLGLQIMTHLISATEHLHNFCTNINLHSEGTLPQSRCTGGNSTLPHHLPMSGRPCGQFCKLLLIFPQIVL